MSNIHLKKDMSSKDLAILNSEMDTAKKIKELHMFYGFLQDHLAATDFIPVISA